MWIGKAHMFRDIEWPGTGKSPREDRRDPMLEIKIRLVFLGIAALIALFASPAKDDRFEGDTSLRPPKTDRGDAQVLAAP